MSPKSKRQAPDEERLEGTSPAFRRLLRFARDREIIRKTKRRDDVQAGE